MINDGNKYILTRSELKEMAACDFEHNNLVICGKYYIHISYFKSEETKERMPVSFYTRVHTRDNLKDLPIERQPQYIRNFIECYAIHRR